MLLLDIVKRKEREKRKRYSEHRKKGNIIWNKMIEKGVKKSNKKNKKDKNEEYIKRRKNE
jgi:hypothetical protein